MNVDILRVVVAGALLLHGIAHAVALGATVLQSLSGPSGTRVTIRPWLLPALGPRAAALLALPFWAVSTFCFLAASVTFWGLLSVGVDWRQLAVAGALVSLAGIAVFPATWPGSPTSRRSLLNTSIAVAFDLVILLAQFWFRWPPQGLFGK